MVSGFNIQTLSSLSVCFCWSLSYGLLISVFVLEKLMSNLLSGNYFSFIIWVLICSYELTSIVENLSIINPNISFLSGLVRVFKEVGESTVKNLEDKVDDITKDLTDAKKSGKT